MAIRYWQNKNRFDIELPIAEGNTLIVKPSEFVIDNLGTVYGTQHKLTEVSQGNVIQSKLVYTYNPIAYAPLDSTTGKVGSDKDLIFYGVGAPSSLPGRYATEIVYFPIGSGG